MVTTIEKQRKKKPSKKQLEALAAGRVKWKKGQSGNPSGPPKTKHYLRRYVEQYMNMPPQEIKALVNDEAAMNELKASQVIAIKHVFEMMQKNDFNRLKEEFDRDDGRVDQNLNNVNEFHITIERV